MTVNYTTNLSLGQPVTGTESGTWGDDVNNSVTSYLDIAIAGGLAVTVTTADVTLTNTQGTSSATNIGSTTAQYAILNVSGAMTAARNLILPSSSRQYVINNNTTGGFLLTVKGSATSGVTLVNGEKAHVFWNGSDYAKLSNAQGGAGSFTNLAYTGTLTGSTGVIAIGTNQIYKDASGNVGIGTSSPQEILEVKTATATQILVGAGLGFTYGIGRETVNGYLRFYGNQTTAVGYIFTGVDGERMRIDSSGNVGIGTSSPAGKLEVSSAATNEIRSTVTSSAGNVARFTLKSPVSFYAWYVADNINALIAYDYNASAERMRIDSSGNLLVGTTTATLNNVGCRIVSGTSNSDRIELGSAASTNATIGYSMYSTGAAAYRFYVGWGGTIYATSATITAISDQRLKENIRDLDDGLTSVMGLKPRKFDWKEGKGADIKNARGFIAQEFEQVFPDMIDTWQDPAPDGEEPYKAVRADLIPTLVKAIQEQQALITSLTARIEALEAT